MTENELRQQEIQRRTDRTIRQNRFMNLSEKRQFIVVNQNDAVTHIVNFSYFFFSALELLLLTRLILHFVGVNSANGFARFIDGLSYPFVALFTGLMNDLTIGGTVGGTAVLEITTLIAMLFWSSVAVLVGQLTWLVFSRTH